MRRSETATTRSATERGGSVSKKIRRQWALILLLLAVSAPIAAQKHNHEKTKLWENAAGLPEVLWRDPGDVGSLNLSYGAGGMEHAPDPGAIYTFVSEDRAQTSPKIEVEDSLGVRWKVKLGREPQSETAATRLLWAAGYFVEDDYYLSEIKVTGLPALHRGQTFVSADGSVRNVRLKRHLNDVKKVGTWDWFDNPFLNTRELNGLRVMMALLNNWDLSTANNSIVKAHGERRYLVADVGATFGATGNHFTHSKSVLRDYADSKFIEAVTADSVDFVMHSRPFFLTIFDIGFYRARARMEQITKHIPRSDARWLGLRLSRLSEEQLRDGFRAAGYTPPEIDGYTKALTKRLAELSAL